MDRSTEKENVSNSQWPLLSNLVLEVWLIGWRSVSPSNNSNVSSNSQTSEQNTVPTDKAMGKIGPNTEKTQGKTAPSKTNFNSSKTINLSLASQTSIDWIVSVQKTGMVVIWKVKGLMQQAKRTPSSSIWSRFSISSNPGSFLLELQS